MQIDYYQDAPAQQISALSLSDFSELVKQKIYQINSSFSRSPKCMQRLVGFIKMMKVDKLSLKIARDVIKYFQAPVLFFFIDFYQRNKNILSQLQKQYKESQQKQAKTMLDILKQIGLVYTKLTEGQQQIDEFYFFTKYGISQKQLTVNNTSSKYHSKYLQFLSKCFVVLENLNSKNSKNSKQNIIYIIKRIQKDFSQLIKDRSCILLEKMALISIIEKCKMFIEPMQMEKSLLVVKSKVTPVKNISSQIEKQQHMSTLRLISPCCRQYFYERENLSHAQSLTLQYKDYKYPYDKYCVKNLRRAICGFLNMTGGVILVGVYERQDDMYRQIKGQILSEYKKEQMLKAYKHICQQIQPDVVAQGKYAVKFVPIKQSDGKYIPGKYIVRVQVRKGDQKSYYTIKEYFEKQDDTKEIVAFRTQNEVLKRQINQEILTNYKQKLLNPIQYKPVPICPQPEIGIPLLEDNKKTSKHRAYDDQQEDETYHQDKKQKYTQKIQPCSPPSQSSKLKDFVYFKARNSNEDLSTKNSKGKGFICDEDDDEQVKGQQRQLKGQAKQSKQNKQCDDEQLNFQPLNPVVKRNYQNSTKQRQYMPPSFQSTKNFVHHQTHTHYQTYRVDRVEHVRQPQVSSIDMLIAGFPYKEVKPLIVACKITLVEQPIQCNNDSVTWIKIVNQNILVVKNKIEAFMSMVSRRRDEIGGENKLKIRKLYQNICFQDEILLNKLIHRFRHNEQFCDGKGVYYYACKDNYEAIQAYTIGWQLDIKTKFISREEMKMRKLEYLKSRAQTKR